MIGMKRALDPRETCLMELKRSLIGMETSLWDTRRGGQKFNGQRVKTKVQLWDRLAAWGMFEDSILNSQLLKWSLECWFG